ncbi:MAG: DMT family transporter [Legionellales bacterium]|nr:DMT family transporter [Legionellales bacterium]
MKRENLFLGVILTLLSCFIYGVQTVIIKFYSAALPPLPVLIFIQSITSFVLMLPFLANKTVLKNALVFNDVPLHLLRTIFSLSISYMLFYAVTFVPLINATLLVNTAPLFVPLFAYLFLSHKINHRLWFPLLLGFTGVVLVLHPASGDLHPALLLALGAGMCWASSMLSVRRLSMRNTTQTITLYFALFSTIFSGVISITFWEPISFFALSVCVLLGVLYFLIQYTATWALKHAGAQLFGVLSYSSVVYASIFSIVFWQQIPSYFMILGMVCIVMGGIMSILVEYRKQSEQKGLETMSAS